MEISENAVEINTSCAPEKESVPRCSDSITAFAATGIPIISTEVPSSAPEKPKSFITASTARGKTMVLSKVTM